MIEFTLEGPCFSINKTYYASKKILTKEARSWIDNAYAQLEQHTWAFDKLRSEFTECGGHFEINIEVRYPMEKFYNKQGYVSSRTIDVTNFEKILVDVIFSKLQLNDKYLLNMKSSKKVGDREHINVSLHHYVKT